MSQYISIIVWLVAVYILSFTINVYTTENVFGKKEMRVSKGFAVLAVIPLIWWTIVRPLSFGDSDAYMRMFNALPASISSIPTYIAGVEKDKGFSVLSILIKSVVGQDYKLYFATMAIVQGIILVLVFRKYSSNFLLALFLFVTTTDYLSWMHNGVRQFTAVILIFAATRLMLEKKYIPLIAIILLASTIHGSALLMIPIVFVVQGKSWNKKTLLAILFFGMAIVFVDNFTNLLDTLLADTQYTNVVSDWQLSNDDGTNPVRVLVYAIPTLLSVVGIKHIKAAKDPVIDLACNMGILSTMLYCLSAVTSGIFIGRLPIYCSLYATGILLPWELDNIFTKESSRIVKMGVIVGFLLFYYYQIHITWGLV
ncbi:EpsG family protein [bacterium]|nr:EpsG family protein [bacterium]MDY3021229.1 EpsG family protein [Oliverpabstia sp.]